VHIHLKPPPTSLHRQKSCPPPHDFNGFSHSCCDPYWAQVSLAWASARGAKIETIAGRAIPTPRRARSRRVRPERPAGLRRGVSSRRARLNLSSAGHTTRASTLAPAPPPDRLGDLPDRAPPVAGLPDRRGRPVKRVGPVPLQVIDEQLIRQLALDHPFAPPLGRHAVPFR